jgi:hypothetical protein
MASPSQVGCSDNTFDLDLGGICFKIRAWKSTILNEVLSGYPKFLVENSGIEL